MTPNLPLKPSLNGIRRATFIVQEVSRMCSLPQRRNPPFPPALSTKRKKRNPSVELSLGASILWCYWLISMCLLSSSVFINVCIFVYCQQNPNNAYCSLLPATKNAGVEYYWLWRSACYWWWCGLFGWRQCRRHWFTPRSVMGWIGLWLVGSVLYLHVTSLVICDKFGDVWQHIWWC